MRLLVQSMPPVLEFREPLSSPEWVVRAQRLLAVMPTAGITAPDLLTLAKQKLRWPIHDTTQVLAWGDPKCWRFLAGKWFARAALVR